MDGLVSILSTAKDLALVLFGFGLIIFLHELGHYLAARWAGIRVLAFALGFGPALFSWRKGLGFRRGSTEREVQKLLDAASDEAPPGPKRDAARAKLKGQSVPGTGPDSKGHPGVSPTEYRFNILPLGGYVKMLGQDDADPTARSDAPDSYQNCKPVKRMVVISAGVIFNVITAAILFVIVFTAGLKTEAPIIGFVNPGSPASKAPAQQHIAQGHIAQEGKDTLPAREPAGLLAGDEVIAINGELVHSFKDITLAVAMAAKNQPVELTVRRLNSAGASEEKTLRVTPEPDEGSRLLAIGVGPASSTTLAGDGRQTSFPPSVQAAFERAGFAGVKPGDRLEAVLGGEQGIKGPGDQGTEGSRQETEKTPSAPLSTPHASLSTARVDLYTHLEAAAKGSGGRPIPVRIISAAAPGVASAAASPRVVNVAPIAELQSEVYDAPSIGGSSNVRRKGVVEHLAGLSMPMGVQAVSEKGEASGLKPGDVFALLGDVQWPTQPEGILEIKKRAGRTIPVMVWRMTGEGPRFVKLDNVMVHADNGGTIGFTPAPANTLDLPNAQGGATLTQTIGGIITASWPSGAPGHFSGVTLNIPAGSVITAVNATPVTTLTQFREALRAEAIKAGGSLTVKLTFRGLNKLGVLEDEANARTIDWALSESEREAIVKLSWRFPLSPGDFELVQTTLRADGLFGAIKMGLHETKNAMTMTYITFARLFQGTVKVEHLRGPVGIAHAGTLIADKGLIWLLFFMGIISINLAVVNFLPLPIVDGGHFLFLVYEQITGKPVSVAVQNITTIAGLGLIVVVFLVVTYNDVMRLIGLA